MTKLNFKHFSKASLITRIVLTTILLVLLLLLFLYEKPISQSLYNWSDEQFTATSQVSFIDVGQGDATLLELPDGKNMLVDCGPSSSSDDLVDYLNDQGVETIDYFLITHPDADHVGGGVAIFENFNVLEFYRPLIYSSSEENTNNYPVHDTQVYDNLIKAAVEEQCAMFFTSDALSWGSVDGAYFIQVLYPDTVYSDSNDASAVLKAEIEGFSFLLTGDADTGVEEKLIEEYGNTLHAEVLKVGHHGSRYSTSTEFVETVGPSYAIISVGNNSYGHPSEQVLNILSEAGVTTLTTLEEGDIVASIGSGRLNVGGLDGRHIDLAMITVIIAIIILMLWGVPDFWRKKSSTNTQK